MRAVMIDGNGGVECLRVDEVPSPRLADHQVRVSVTAAGLNRADILQRKGFYPAPPGVAADIPGLEFAGIIVELGRSAQGWNVGDRVMGIVGGGAMASELCVDAEQLLRVPVNLDLEQAAGIPEAFLTAFDALEQANARDGHTVLIHAAPSGVGTALIQLARLWKLTTVGTSRSPHKLDRAIKLGLEHAICVSDGSFIDAYRALGLEAPDIIIDLVGGHYTPQNLELVAKRGRTVLVGLVGGRKAELDLGMLLRKRATLIGTVLRSRPDAEKRALCRTFSAEAIAAFDDQRMQPVVDQVLPFERIAEAHERMEANDTFGKIVLSWKASA